MGLSVPMLVCVLLVSQVTCDYGTPRFDHSTNCTNTTTFNCGVCKEINTKLYADETVSPFKIKYNWTCTTCIQGTPKGERIYETFSNSELVAGSRLIDAGELCYSIIITFTLTAVLHSLL